MIGTRRRFPPCQPLGNFLKNLEGPHILEVSNEDIPHEWLLFVDSQSVFFWRDGLISQIAVTQMVKKCRYDFH